MFSFSREKKKAFLFFFYDLFFFMFVCEYVLVSVCSVYADALEGHTKAVDPQSYRTLSSTVLKHYRCGRLL